MNWRSLLLVVGFCAAGAEPVKLQVVLLNERDVPPRIMAEAKEYYSAVLRHAGITVEWLNPDPGSNLKLDPSAVVVHIVSSDQAKRLRSRIHRCLGVASVSPARRTVYTAVILYDRIRAVARAHAVRLPTVLGHIMVHETGHLLLGRGHSVSGVMKTSLRTKDFIDIAQGRGSFTRAEASKIRRTLTARLQGTRPMVLAGPAKPVQQKRQEP